MAIRCPLCESLVTEVRPVHGNADREQCEPCGCEVPARRILRVREYAARAMAHRDAAGERRRGVPPRAR
jgi:hypothetical protein